MTQDRDAGDGRADSEPLLFERADLLENWLERHHAERTGLWLKIAKKDSGIASVTAAEVVDAVLCHGWIDGQRKSLDQEFYLQRISPRRRGSNWSLVNVGKVEALTAAGRMRESGLAEVRAAQADGRWAAAYPSQREATVPDDLAATLAADRRAGARFEQLTRAERYLVLLQLMTARTPEVRAARLARMTARLAAGEPVR
ncbi:YdeI/OmpD-associated family protein [Streptomyces sp. NPDC002793]|uniref:YdeI/OmpD-associated family protein n=1 Tax=Streptomyces sp. NPDC002793 TaxID=3154432 RepID=UPI003331F7AE